MIGNIQYNEVVKIAKELEDAVKVVEQATRSRQIDDLNDFISTVSGYSKFLNTSVQLYQDADDAIKELITKE